MKINNAFRFVWKHEKGNKMTLKLKVIENTLPLSVNCFRETLFYTFQNSLTPHLRR